MPFERQPFDKPARTGEVAPVGSQIDREFGIKTEESCDLPCRYCQAPCSFLVGFIDGMSRFNVRARAHGEHEIRRGDVAVCTDCRPRYEQDCNEQWAAKDREVASVCRSIRNGMLARAPKWMVETAWANKKIQAARVKYNRGDIGEDALE